jgi:small subunit ribosomal protein S20
MPHSNQAKKRVRQNETARLRNKAEHSAVRTSLKKTLQAIADNDLEKAKALLPEAMSRLDRAAKHNVIHANAAARQKSRLAGKVAAMEKGA